MWNYSGVVRFLICQHRFLVVLCLQTVVNYLSEVIGPKVKNHRIFNADKYIT